MSSYNYARYLPDSIESVLNQTFPDFELFILDDASTDDSWEIIQSYSDPRIIAQKNDVNQHSVAGVNRFISQVARGDFIAVHHSDNYWEPEKLQKQVDFLDAHPEVGAVFTNAQVIDENGDPLKDQSNPNYSIFDQPNRNRHEWLNYFFMVGNSLCHNSILIRKKCYADCGLYRLGLGLLLDMDMWVRLCLKYEIHVLPEKLASYRILTSGENISGDRPDTRVRHLFEYLQILNNYRQISSFDEFVNVFPSAQKYIHPDGWDMGYVLGMTTLEERRNSHIFQLFGLNLLFDALQDPQRSQKLKDLYGFTHKDFIKLTGQFDFFSFEIKANLRKRLSQKSNLLQGFRIRSENLNHKISEKNKQIKKLRTQTKALRRKLTQKNRHVSILKKQLRNKSQEIHHLALNISQQDQKIQSLSEKLTHMQTSRNWHFGKRLIRILEIIAPPNSLRDKMLKGIYRGFLRPLVGGPNQQNIKKFRSIVASSNLFDEAWYLEHNPDVATSKMDPLKHYLVHGGFEGRDPGLNFSSQRYLERYEDVRLARINPLIHYLQCGKNEGRSIFPHQS